MSLHSNPIGPVPEETARVARAAFRKGNLYLRIRDELGTIYDDALFADLFSHTGQPAEAPWRLALVCVLQYLEDLSDRQAADAVRGRMDWKYLLGLELSDPGFDASVLTEFRARLVSHQASQRLFEHLVAQLSERGWIKKRGVQRTDSTHVLAAVRRLNRLELLGETVRAALNALAAEEPEWLKQWVPVARGANGTHAASKSGDCPKASSDKSSGCTRLARMVLACSAKCGQIRLRESCDTSRK